MSFCSSPVLTIKPSFLSIATLTGLLVSNMTPIGFPDAHAQVPPPPITSSGLNTQINLSSPPPIGKVQYDITGGIRPGGGTNLFHSFGDFSVPTNNIANFLNAGSIDLNGNVLAPNLPTSNILGRVTGGNPSAIFGTIQTNGTGGFGNANLFLMNPTGFLFGPNATVNVGGMVAFTTADYLRLSNGVLFNNTPNVAQDMLLSAAPVAAFGFLGSNPAAIAVQGDTLKVAQGQTLSFMGGNQGFTYMDPDTGNIASVPGGVTMTGGKLSAPGGQINLVSVASPGEILLAGLQSAPNINGQSFTTMGNITLSQGATLDVSENAAGTVRIRGGKFVMDQATISANTVDANGAPIAIDINVTGDISISTVDVPALTARTTGSGDAGEIRVSSANMDVTATTLENFAFPVIDSHTSGSRKAGNVSIMTGDLTVAVTSGVVFFIDSGTNGPAGGHGGDVTIKARTIDAENTFITTGTFNTGFFVDPLSFDKSTGNAGNVTISGDSLHMAFSQIVTDAASFTHGTGRSGDITLTAEDISLNFSSLSSSGHERGGAITINADHLVAVASGIQALTNLTPGGAVTVKGNIIELTGSTFASTTQGDGDAASITITATDHLGLLRPSFSDGPTGIFSNSIDVFGPHGSSGNVMITTPRLEMTGGARINTITATSGSGGNVTINTTDSISMSGENAGFPPEPLFLLGDHQPSGIFTQTIGSTCLPCGNAGNVSITTGSLAMGSGAQINSGTSSAGQGGNISIAATNTIAMSGTVSTGQPGGILSRTIGTSSDAGTGGNIAVTAGQSVTISDGASVSASSTGAGNTGNIQINAGNQFTMTNSKVTTEANQASGGAIKITTNPSGTVQLTNSTISASVLDGTGGGGSVDIDPLYVILLDSSHILANAVEGPGGNITINITNGGLFLPDATSTVSASSQFGVNGTVTIQSPNAPASGKIQPLGKTPLQATSLLNQRCASLAGGEFSSFTVAGRDSLPTEPGSWLASPLYAAGEGHGVRGKGLEALNANAGLGARGDGLDGDAPILSLRQIAPAGFLTQTFAVDWSASCQS